MSPLNAQLPHLETFARAAELSSFSAAAQALRVTQAAVSQRVQALEKVLGTSLFQRRGGRVHITDAGRKLYAFTQEILMLHRRARAEITGHKTPATGELLLAASSIPGEHLLPALLSGFRHEQPHLQVRATVSDSAAVLAQLEKGNVHVGLVGRKVERNHLVYRRIGHDRMMLVVPPGHPLANQKKITIKRLQIHPLILREAGSGLRHCLEKSLAKADKTLADFQVALELGSNEAIKEAVMRGVGVAILSVYAVQKELRDGTLHGIQVIGLGCDRDLYVVHDRRRVLPAPAQLFLVYLEAHPLPASLP